MPKSEQTKRHPETAHLTGVQLAEWERLHRALNNGPGRRMMDDTLAGRPFTRADMAQAERYRSLMAALVRGA